MQQYTRFRRLREIQGQLPYLPRAFKLVWQAAPRWTLAWMTLLVLQALVPVALVYLTRAMVDGLAMALGNEVSWVTLRRPLLLAALLGGAWLLSEALLAVGSWIRAVQSERAEDLIMDRIHIKCIEVDLDFYETPDHLDLFHRVRTEARHQPLALLESCAGLLQSTITLVAMLLVLVSYTVWLPLAILASALPAFFIALDHNTRRHRWRVEVTASERRSWYYHWLITASEVAAELRLYDLGDHFRSCYRSVRSRLRKERLQLEKDHAIFRLAAGTSALFVAFGSMAWVLWRALGGSFTLGDLALLYQAFHHGQRSMRSLLEKLGGLYGSLPFLGDLFEFQSLQPKLLDPASILSPPEQLSEGIRFEGVSFKYPGTNELVFEQLNLHLAVGEITAVVGPNGAGKSTLVKLLCRLYDPMQGRILLDGADLRRFQLAELRSMYGVLLQQPVHYSGTVAENIGLGDLAPDQKLAAVERAAFLAGAEGIVETLPDGYETLLGKWFEGGLELSVGEWQRLALARAIARRAPILLLDEPTSAMDSWAEAAWVDRLREHIAHQVCLIITHRFSTAQCAETIHVMDGGRIVESGRHEELLTLGGMYAQSWRAQMPVELVRAV